MTNRIEATYENGVFKPVSPVSIPEGSRVVIQLPAQVRQEPPYDPEATARILAEIAALPPEGPEPDDGLSGARDHDKILYGGPKGAL